MSDVIKDLSELRLSYEQGELHEGQVESNPHQQFLGWFNHALAANLHEPYAMSLATQARMADLMFEQFVTWGYRSWV